jgi:aspartyl aminopeptidase
MCLQVKIDRPIMRIPMLAIHLYREIGEQGFKPNKQNHVVPILATALKAAANSGAVPEVGGSGEAAAQASVTDYKEEENGAAPAQVRAPLFDSHHPDLEKSVWSSCARLQVMLARNICLCSVLLILT